MPYNNLKYIYLFACLSMLTLALCVGYVYALYDITVFNIWAYMISPENSMQATIFVYATAPRILGGILSGVALAVSACLLQMIYKNPLLSSSTLGMVSSVKLMMVLGMIFFSFLTPYEHFIVQYIYTLLVIFFIFRISQKWGSNGIVIIGLLAGFIQSAFTAFFVLYHNKWLDSLFFWNLGDVLNSTWSNVWLLYGLVVPILCILYLMRLSIQTLDLDTSTAQSIGVNVVRVHKIFIVLSVFLSVVVISLFGVIGFVGIVAPNIARMKKNITPKMIVLLSAFIGAWVVLIADFTSQLLDKFGLFDSFMTLPAGVFTSMIGGVMIIILSIRYRIFDITKHQLSIEPLGYIKSYMVWIVMSIFIISTIFRGHTDIDLSHIYDYIFMGENNFALQERFSRLFLSVSVGLGSALCGAILQILLKNPLVSPEILGVSSISSCGIILALIFFPSYLNSVHSIGIGVLGAIIGFLCIAYVVQYGYLTTGGMVILGIALTATFSALSQVFMIFASAQQIYILQWLNGSLNSIDSHIAMVSMIIIWLCIVGLFVFKRYITVLPLGKSINISIGVPYKQGYMIILGICSILIGAVVVILGPISLVGLVAPYFAKFITGTRHKYYMFNTMILGAGLLTLSDGIGRTLHSTIQLPMSISFVVVIFICCVVMYCIGEIIKLCDKGVRP